MNLVLFDLDNTLLPIDSDYSWGEFTNRLGWNDPVAFKAQNDRFYADYQAGVLNIHDYVRFATEAVKLKNNIFMKASFGFGGRTSIAIFESLY